MFACCPFSSRRPPSPPASSWTSGGEAVNTHAPTAAPSAQEEIPHRVTIVTKQAFQSPRHKEGSLSSAERPFSVTSIPSFSPQDRVQAIGPDSEAADLVTPLHSPRRSTLHRYPPIQHSPLQLLMLGNPVYVEDSALTNVALPNTPDNSVSDSPVRFSQQRCEISNKSRSTAVSSEKKEESSDEGISAVEIIELILSEHRPNSMVPESARRTRLVFSNEEREIYHISLSDDPEGIFFDLKSRASTPSMHGISQGFDDD